jgi:anti-sigma B factor antagonist
LRVDARPGDILVLSGELDMATAPQLLAALERLTTEGVSRIVLELSGLQFCDSSGLSVFVQAHQALQAEGGALQLRHPSARLSALLATTSLDHELDIQ